MTAQGLILTRNEGRRTIVPLLLLLLLELCHGLLLQPLGVYWLSGVCRMHLM